MQGGSAAAMLGNLVVALFMVQFLSSVFIRQETSLHSLALGGGALAHYFIPTALLRGDEPTHYVFVALSFFVVVAAAGTLRVFHWAAVWLRSSRPAWADGLAMARVFLLALAIAPLACLTFVYFLGTLDTLRNDQAQAREEQAALDRLPLEGKRVCCRNMTWFLDRNVVTAFFPYCDVAGLERYVRGQGLDGLLLWENERQLMFKITPYESPGRFEEALRDSGVFKPPQVSGAWRWFPVKRETENTTQTGKKKPTLWQAASTLVREAARQELEMSEPTVAIIGAVRLA